MSDFQALMGESTDYGADGTPVHPEEPNTVAENMTEVMGDSVLNHQGENMGAETQDEPLPPAPADINNRARWAFPRTYKSICGQYSRPS